MHCPNCENQISMEPTTERLPFSGIGLSGVTVPTLVYRCQCGEKFYQVPREREILQALAKHIIHQASPLSGEQIRFLRTELKLKGIELAAKLGVGAKMISRWEHEANRPSSTADRLIRLLYAGMALRGMRSVTEALEGIDAGATGSALDVFVEGGEIVVKPGSAEVAA
jgi:putative zinc finger/helix-turn-helix YgiT family protein